MTRTWSVQAGSEGTGVLRMLAKVSRGPAGEIVIDGEARGSRKKRRADAYGRALDEMRARSPVRDELRLHLAMPAEEHARRALAYWSYSAWFATAGYRWVDSDGAQLVRRFLLDPNPPLPAGVYFAHGQASMPFPDPLPVVVVRSGADRLTDLADIDEFIGLGVQWGPAVIALPFANDDTGAVWRSLERLLEEDALRTVRRLDLVKLLAGHAMSGDVLDAVTIQRDGVDAHVITDQAPRTDIEALAAGRSPRVLVPRTGIIYSPSPPVERHELGIVATPEFGGPMPRRPRVWRWLRCRLDFGDIARLVRTAYGDGSA